MPSHRTTVSKAKGVSSKAKGVSKAWSVSKVRGTSKSRMQSTAIAMRTFRNTSLFLDYFFAFFY